MELAMKRHRNLETRKRRNAEMVRQFCRLFVMIVLFAGCRKSETLPALKQEAPAQSPPAVPADIPTRVDIPVPPDDSDRWLFVQKVAGKATGGWATGSFDADRNKLSVTTSDVEEFAVDTSRITVNWKKLVVLSIDGKNSELRKRDYDILVFTRTPHGEWIVREP
jgi:hypothetical protein